MINVIRNTRNTKYVHYYDQGINTNTMLKTAQPNTSFWNTRSDPISPHAEQAPTYTPLKLEREKE